MSMFRSGLGHTEHDPKNGKCAQKCQSQKMAWVKLKPGFSTGAVPGGFCASSQGAKFFVRPEGEEKTFFKM